MHNFWRICCFLHVLPTYLVTMPPFRLKTKKLSLKQRKIKKKSEEKKKGDRIERKRERDLPREWKRKDIKKRGKNIYTAYKLLYTTIKQTLLKSSSQWSFEEFYLKIWSEQKHRGTWQPYKSVHVHFVFFFSRFFPVCFVRFSFLLSLNISACALTIQRFNLQFNQLAAAVLGHRLIVASSSVADPGFYVGY